MPDMSGIEVALQVRADPKIGRVPIVFLTATVSDGESSVAAGSLMEFPVIAKPATAQQIIDRIEIELASRPE